MYAQADCTASKHILFQPQAGARLLDRNAITRIDTGMMHAVYDKWPCIAADAYNCEHDSNIHNNISSAGDIDHIVFAGMGGSGAIGDLFAAILSKTPIHVTITKGYEMPKTVNKDTLVIATSVSGNTKETLSALDAASKTDAHIVGVSSGGVIERLCRSRGHTHVPIKMTHSPRASFAGVVFSMLRALVDVLPLRPSDVSEAIRRLQELGRTITSDNINRDCNVSQRLAEQMAPVPLIYHPFGLRAAAVRFKNDLQENAKTHAMVEDVLEACHNGIVAWENRSENLQAVGPVMITGSDDHPKTKERWQILAEYFESRGISVEEVKSGDGGILAKLMGLSYVTGYASIYRAVIMGIDPTPISAIDFVKKRLYT